jgi:predicted O-linked N-acetylglucosamine transferase (SPINDLY family)
LPAQGVVFSSFNSSYKFREPVFAIWMRLLHAIEGSVLWLLAANSQMAGNLRQQALRHGIEPTRLIFAPRVELADHLARQRLADLFLDTLPYNAGATASAAIWAGVPLLTCVGEGMVGRMAASMLMAAGLPELVTTALGDYEARALELARDAPLLAALRAKLDRNRRTQPFFDVDRTRRHIESAYTTMWDIWQRGETPRYFAVAPLND